MGKKLDQMAEDISAIRMTLERINEDIYSLKQTVDASTNDEIYPKAKELAIKKGYASPALFQRLLHVGYARAAGLMDTLEKEGIIEPADGASPRKVIT